MLALSAFQHGERIAMHRVDLDLALDLAPVTVGQILAQAIIGNRCTTKF